ncbi:MAG TPA: hypothetical protein VGP46_04815 [Acidimicrobiales bacterium]|nr:hypothetical protein [Acidimicrobiales bacterium]
MVFLVAAVVGLAFGVGDQYLGSLMATGMWTAAVSLMSAPWLVFPFLFGCSQGRGRRAARLGLVATMAALAGYFLMILGPFEGGHSAFTWHAVQALLWSNRLNIVGGLVTGPLYGLLGQRWRTQRAWVSALLVAGALCLEPFVLKALGRIDPGTTHLVWIGEILAGLVSGSYFLASGVAFRRRTEGAGS